MITDSRNLRDGEMIDTGVCVIGGGPAGIALALEMRGGADRVTIIESGQLDPGNTPDPLDRAVIGGQHEIDLTSRRRGFGGATQAWGGNSAWFDPVDFEHRAHVPCTAWPFGNDELRRYQSRAAALCGLEGLAFDPQELAENNTGFAASRLPLDPECLVTKPVWRWPQRFGQTCRGPFEKPGGNLDLITGLTVTRLEDSASTGRIDRVIAVTADGKKVRVKAHTFVLAAGIESVRLLLVAREAGLAALRQGHQALGEGFMVHVNVPWGILVPARRSPDLGLYTLEPDEPIDQLSSPALHAGLQLAPKLQRNEKTLNHMAFLVTLNEAPLNITPEVLAEAGRIRRGAALGPGGSLRWLADAVLGERPYFAIRHFVEQAPSPGRALRLSEERDALGMPRLRVDWSLERLEQHTIRKALETLALEFARTRTGRLFWDLPPDGSEWPAHLSRGSHFMGGARMGTAASDSVVNANGRVHNLQNLFVAGAAVMPGSGANMVTCNLLALTLRLADHLKTQPEI